MGNRVFKPNLWAALAVVIGCAVCVSLGVWQLQRGLQKAELLAQFEAAADKAPRALSAGSWPEEGVLEPAQTRGVFEGSMQLLLDNQTHDRVPGYRVWTPLRLDVGGLLIVDRGWVPADGDRSKLPEIPVPEGPVELTGFFRTLPQPGMRPDGVDNCAGGPWPRVVQYPTIEELRCLYGDSVAGGILLMDPELPGGFVRAWSSGPELSPTKHYGYAGQWFLFALVLLALFLKLSFKSKT